MPVSLVCTDLDKGFVFDDVGCEVASVDAPSIDPNRSFTLKHPRTGGMTVYNEGTTAPGVCPRSGVGRIGAKLLLVPLAHLLDRGAQETVLPVVVQLRHVRGEVRARAWCLRDR